MRKTRLLVTLAALASLLSACAADPKAANETNFGNAINSFLSEGQRGALCFTSVPFPHTVNAYDADGVKAQLNEMLGAGLVRQQTKTVKVQDWGWGPPVKRLQTLYDLTPTGKSAMASNQEYAGSSFCFGHLRVAKIVKFTEPGSEMGVTVSQVTWLPRVADLDGWAQKALGAKKLPSVQRLVDQTASTERNETLDLTNKGWEVAH